MKAVTVSVLKKELQEHSHQELMEICLKLAKFKKENKELLTYLLFESHDEDTYIDTVNEEVDIEFSKLNHTSVYYVKKSLRKILRNIKKYIRYSKKKETEAALLLHFCGKLKELKPRHQQNLQINNMYERQLTMAKKAISTLHEDLQYDFQLEIEELRSK
jgi:membrane-anchored protein YejM (alkaline phosphatase superfamily)